MRERLNHYIDGAWVPSSGGTRHEVINPATEEPCSAITLASTADVDRAVAAARRAFDSSPVVPLADRLALLDRVIAQYQLRSEDIALAISEEMGAPIDLARSAQAAAGLAQLTVTRNALAEFTFEEAVLGACVVHEPIGVVALITPWNWPINQIAAKVAPCLAAGNAMVLKPSEECPTSAAIFAEVLDAAGVPAGFFNLVQGSGPVAGAALSSHPDVDMVSFTGSTRAGIMVAQAAAPTVKRVHQELGGKGPNLILEDSDLATQLPPVLQGVIANSGQTCIAPTRLLVPQARKTEVEQFVSEHFRRVEVGDPSRPGKHIGPLVNRAQFDKVQELIQSAIDEGATLLEGGPGMPDGTNRGYFVRPTVFGDVTPDMRIFNEETFGPVATLTPYEGIEEGIALANRTVYGLSAAITGPPEGAREVAPRLRAGIVTINTSATVRGTAFGGYKQSGNGREGGKFGIADFMEIKTIAGG